MPASHLRIVTDVELGPDAGRRAPFSHWAPIATALLVAIAAVAGIFDPAIYARETPSWATQGIAQDWVNLVVAVPWLAISGGFALRGSRRARVLAGAGLLYTAYSFAIYAFAVHFNALFLIYCAVLGISAFGLVDLVVDFVVRDPDRALPWYGERAPIRSAAATLLGLAALFGVRWLTDVLAALARGAPPAELAATGLAANPVHVLDLALVLPAMAVTGIALVRGRRYAQILAPILLGFAALMSVAIVAMVVLLDHRGLATGLAPAVIMAAIAAAIVAVLVGLLRRLRA